MATYVCSDMHGHVRAFDRLLSRASLTDDDHIYVIGDMVDRGPEPLEVLKLVRSLPNCTALMGNHESMMLDALADPSDAYNWLLWSQNGGMVTAEQLTTLVGEAYGEMVRWVRSLPLHEQVNVGGRDFVLVHAGIRPVVPREEGWDAHALEEMLCAQDPDDLLWIREDYFGHHTGLMNEHGEGAIVVSGHTPSVVAEVYADVSDRPARNEFGFLQMLYLGADASTGGMPDRLAIDCGAGSVANYGQVCLLRLDDMEEMYERVFDGE